MLNAEQTRALRAALDPFVVMQFELFHIEKLEPYIVYQGEVIRSQDVELHHYVWWLHYGETLPELDSAELETVDADYELA